MWSSLHCTPNCKLHLSYEKRSNVNQEVPKAIHSKPIFSFFLKTTILRKEGAKSYGTKKAIEGIFTKGQRCLVVEDLVTSGGSALEVAESLQEVGFVFLLSDLF